MNKFIILFLLVCVPLQARNFNIKRYEKYSVKYESYIEGASKKYGIDKDIIKAVISYESNWSAKVIGSGNCVGLMQVKKGHTDAKRNIYSGTGILAHYLKKCNGDMLKALSAYNRGYAGFKRTKLPYTKYALNVIRFWYKIKCLDVKKIKESKNYLDGTNVQLKLGKQMSNKDKWESYIDTVDNSQKDFIRAECKSQFHSFKSRLLENENNEWVHLFFIIIEENLYKVLNKIKSTTYNKLIIK
jgi:hypothetical protein